MIQVKLLGGAKKSFSADMISIDKDNLTIAELIDYLQKTKPENTPDLDVNNLLVVVNGVDSSAIEGKITKLKNYKGTFVRAPKKQLGQRYEPTTFQRS